MDREILFKAKRIDNGGWVEGCLLIDYVSGQYFIHANGNSVNESDKTHEEGYLRFFAYEIDKETVREYTGLTAIRTVRRFLKEILFLDIDIVLGCKVGNTSRINVSLNGIRNVRHLILSFGGEDMNTV